MSVKLRLVRIGKTKQPHYRLVAADSRSPRNGRFIEILGTYNPRSEPSEVSVDNERAVDWLRKGAQPTDTARKLLAISGAWETFTGEPAPPPPPPKPKSAAQPAAEAPPQAEEKAPEAEAPESETPEAAAADETPAEAETPEAAEGTDATEDEATE